VKPGKAGSKPVANRSTKPINFTAHKNPKVMKASAAKAAKAKTRAEAKPAALNVNRQKSAPTIRPAASAGMGQ
jgi:predicted NACHT family NTPase